MPVNDDPIRLVKHDVLGRDAFARSLARDVLGAARETGTVIAVMGPWGVGKTSLVHLAIPHLGADARVRALWFNPWLFSGAGDLVGRFFDELAAQLRIGNRKAHEVAKAVEDYENLVKPFETIPLDGGMGKLLTGLTSTPNKIIELRKGGLEKQRAKIIQALNAMDTKLLMVLDDIDRLDVEEIRDVFKLVSLVGNFPNVVYLLAFDRERVERALTQDGIDGADYLEKIVQIVHTVPEVPRASIGDYLADELSALLKDLVPDSRVDRTRWLRVSQSVILPLIATLRNAKRYIASIRGTVHDLHQHVDIVDLLCAEAIRIFRPGLMSTFARYLPELTVGDRAFDPFRSDSDAQVKARVIDVVGEGDSRDFLASAAVEILFPGAWDKYKGNSTSGKETGELLVRGRIGHQAIAELYFSRFETLELIALRSAQEAYDLANHQDLLENYMRSLPPDTWQATLAAMEHFADQINEDTAVPIIVVITNLLKDIPDPGGLFGVQRPRQSVRDLSYRAMTSIGDREERQTAFLNAIESIERVSDKRFLHNVATVQSEVDDPALDKRQAQEVRNQIVEAFWRLSPGEMAQEQDLFSLVTWIKGDTPLEGDQLGKLFSTEVAPLLLEGAIYPVLNRPMLPDGSEPLGFHAAQMEELLGGREELIQLLGICRGLAENDVSLQRYITVAEEGVAALQPVEPA
jgi:hypothetical protein